MVTNAHVAPIYEEAAMAHGDYVLATKYQDGSPSDQWAVGFYDRFEDSRHYVVDSDGRQFRGNGFRRARKITHAQGEWLLANIPQLEGGPAPEPNIWDLLAAVAAAQVAPAEPAEGEAFDHKQQADNYLEALLGYSGGFYGAAIKAGLPAAETVGPVAHIERAARELHRLAIASPDREAATREAVIEEVDAALTEAWTQDMSLPEALATLRALAQQAKPQQEAK